MHREIVFTAHGFQACYYLYPVSNVLLDAATEELKVLNDGNKRRGLKIEIEIVRPRLDDLYFH